MSIPNYRIDRFSSCSHRWTVWFESRPILAQQERGDIMPKVEIKRVQEHYELYINQTFMCSCDTNELSSSIAEAYQLYYESIIKTR